MRDEVDESVLDEQQSHWESMLTANPEMFGLQPSESAVAAAILYRGAGVKSVVELGAGQGRDSLYFLDNGIDLTVTDYSDAGLDAISERAAALGIAVGRRHVDVRSPLPFPDESFDACYSHMLFCMALTTLQLKALVAEVGRVLRPSGLLTYTARTTDDVHFGTGIDRGDDMFEHGGFVVHFFGTELIEELSAGFEIVDRFNFEEAGLPRRLTSITMRKT